jgi:hypothetical protein
VDNSGPSKHDAGTTASEFDGAFDELDDEDENRDLRFIDDMSDGEGMASV